VADFPFAPGLTSRLTGERPVPGATPDSLLALTPPATARSPHASVGDSCSMLVAVSVLSQSSCRDLGGRSSGWIATRVLRVLRALRSPAWAAGRLHRCRSDGPSHGLVRLRLLLPPRRALRHPGRHVAELARVLSDGHGLLLTPNAPGTTRTRFTSCSSGQTSSRTCCGALLRGVGGRPRRHTPVKETLPPAGPRPPRCSDTPIRSTCAIGCRAAGGGRVLEGVAAVLPPAGEGRLGRRDRDQCRRLLRDRRGRRRHARVVRHRVFTEAAGLVVIAGR